MHLGLPMKSLPYIRVATPDRSKSEKVGKDFPIYISLGSF